jgi:hypothetical protein
MFFFKYFRQKKIGEKIKDFDTANTSLRLILREKPIFFRRKSAKIAEMSEHNIDPRSPWRRGAMDIASASGMRRPGFESRQGIRFLGKHSNAVVYKLTQYALFVC